jgi:uncharacterized cupredoxin-like copper-binding protein
MGSMAAYSDQPAEEILRTRLARGEIDEATYRVLAAALQASRPRRPWRPAWFWAAGIVAAVVLLVGVVGPMIANGATLGYVPGISPCNVPALSGTVVNVTLWDMMGGGTMNGGMMGGRMMAVSASPESVPAGEVSFRVVNQGGMLHELVVLPLAAGQAIGTRARPIGYDGKVSETGSLGEASKSCGQGAGNGIAPGATSWVMLQLQPGRYELICNLQGHYAMGMYTELDVS